jgi:hypothetical protein
MGRHPVGRRPPEKPERPMHEARRADSPPAGGVSRRTPADYQPNCRSGKRQIRAGARSTATSRASAASRGAEWHKRRPGHQRSWLTGQTSSAASQWRVPGVCAYCITREHQLEVWQIERAPTAGSPHRLDERSAGAAPRCDIPPSTRSRHPPRAVRLGGWFVGWPTGGGGLCSLRSLGLAPG